MRVFLDSNVLLSAFATRGLSADVLRLVLAEHELLTAEIVVEEVQRILTAKFRLPHSDVEQLIGFLREHPVEPRPTALPDIEVRDPDDAWVLASAIAAGTEVLITGDADLLALASTVEPQRIINPRGFWELHRSAG